MRLKDYLNLEHLTERDFSDLVKVSQAHINYIIRGKRNPSFHLAKQIKKVTNGRVTLEDLFNPKAPSRLKNKDFDNE